VPHRLPRKPRRFRLRSRLWDSDCGLEKSRDLRELPAGLVLDVETSRYPKNPRQMLETKEDRELLERCIVRVNQPIRTDRDIWRQFMIREAHDNLGNDATLKRDDIGLDDYIFKKRDDGSDYHMKDREAQNWIDPYVVSTLASDLSGKYVGHNKALRALEEFVRRTVLTHMQIFLWYHRAAPASLAAPERLFLPYPTRAPLMPLVSPSDYERIKKLVVPYVLQKALLGPNRRREVLQELIELRGERFAEEIRSDLLRYLRTKDPRVIQEIAEKIYRKSTEAPGENTQILRTGIGATMTGLTADTSTGVSETVESRNAYYQLVRPPAGYDAEEIERRIGRLFPELRAS
jgi:hypothetical protein